MAIDQFRGRETTNPIVSSLVGLGDQITKNVERGRSELKLKGLLDRSQQGDVSALAELAAIAPKAAGVVDTALQRQAQQQAAEEQAERERQINIARAALAQGDPKQARNFLIQVANQELDEELKAEIIDTINMDDDSMLFDLQSAVALGGEEIGLSELDQRKLDIEQQKVDVSREGLDIKRQQVQQELALAQQKLAGKDEFERKDIINLNDKVTKLSDDARKIHASAKSLEALKNNPSPAAKLAAVFKFMKANDPTSTVREGEQGQVYAAEGAMKGFANKINALLGKGGLSASGFLDLVNTAKVMANEEVNSANREVDSFLSVFPALTVDQFDRLKNRVPKVMEIEREEVQLDEQFAPMRARFDALPDDEKQKFLDSASEATLEKLGLTRG